MAGKKKKNEKDAAPGRVSICRNRKARHHYEILDKLECGLVLQGSEVKSLRAGKATLDEAFARIENDEVWLYGADIAEYPQANLLNHAPKRRRKLLMKKREIEKFAGSADQSGLTLVPLELYFQRGFAKVLLAIGRGRKLHDKRDALKKKTDVREMQQAKLRARG